MKHIFSILFVFGFLTVGMIAELSAQVPTVEAVTSATRRSSLFGGTRAGMFRSDGSARDAERIELKGKSLDTKDPLMDLTSAHKPSETLTARGRNNMDIFLITSPTMLEALNLDNLTVTPEAEGELIVGEIDTDVTATAGTSAIRQGIYAPRLRYVPTPEELAAMQTPEAIAKMDEANQLRAKELRQEIIDKFELPDSANMSLEFLGSTVFVRGRVPSPIQRKQVEMYLGLESGIYFVQNDLTVDPSMSLDRLETEPTSPNHNDPAAP